MKQSTLRIAASGCFPSFVACSFAIGNISVCQRTHQPPDPFHRNTKWVISIHNYEMDCLLRMDQGDALTLSKWQILDSSKFKEFVDDNFKCD